MSSLAHAKFTPSGALAFTRRVFDRAAVEAIKAEIPAAYRGYDPATKEWTVAGVGGWPEHALRVLRRFGEVAVVEDKRAAREPVAIRRDDAHVRELHLLPSAPAAVVRIVYLALAKANHPDRGGDEETMRRINAAYEAIRARASEAAS